MRWMKRPHYGFGSDADQRAYWRLERDMKTSLQPKPALGMSLREHGDAGFWSPATTSFGGAPALFGNRFGRLVLAPSLSAGTISAYASTKFALDGSVGLSTFRPHRDWTCSFWCGFGDKSTATQTVFEHSGEGVNIQNGLSLGIVYSPSGVLSVRTETSHTVFASAPAPTNAFVGSGLVGIVKQEVGGDWRYRYFFNGDFVGETFLSVNSSATVGSTASCHVFFGRSDRSGPLHPFKGEIGEFALWQKAFSPEKMRSLYADCVRSWDEKTLFESGNYDCLTRVRVQRAAGSSDTPQDDLVDLSIEAGHNWVSSVEIDRDVESAGDTARIQLFRSVAPFPRELGIPPVPPPAVGGDAVVEYTDGGIDYRAHIFHESGTLAVNQALDVEYLLVGGGGGGGGALGAGGGAGGLLTNVGGPPLPVAPGTHTMTVGSGGAGGPSGGNSTPGLPGEPSSAFSLTALGGGGSCGLGPPLVLAGSGGSGGGGWAPDCPGAAGTAGQGHAGGSGQLAGSYSAGGGGGAAGAGAGAVSSGLGGAGGAGVQSSITGTAKWYAGGGGGGAFWANYGNNDATDGRVPAETSAAANTGSGGGGAVLQQLAVGGAGGSGIVVVRYAIP